MPYDNEPRSEGMAFWLAVCVATVLLPLAAMAALVALL